MENEKMRRGIKDFPWLSNWKDGIAICWDEDCRRSRFERQEVGGQFDFGHARFEILLEINWKCWVDSWIFRSGFRGTFQAGESDFGVESISLVFKATSPVEMTQEGSVERQEKGSEDGAWAAVEGLQQRQKERSVRRWIKRSEMKKVFQRPESDQLGRM